MSFLATLLVLVHAFIMAQHQVSAESEFHASDFLDCRASGEPAPIVRLIDAAINATSAARYLIASVAWLWPLAILLVLPVAFVVLLYFSALLVQLFCLRAWLWGGLHGLPTTDEMLLRLVAAIWEAHGRAFHGYEVVGMEKLPPVGHAAFLVYYHGTVPLDAYYFMARHNIQRNRHPVPVVDRFLFRMPGLQRILRLTHAMEGSVNDCVALLNPSLAASASTPATPPGHTSKAVEPPADAFDEGVHQLQVIDEREEEDVHNSSISYDGDNVEKEYAKLDAGRNHSKYPPAGEGEEVQKGAEDALRGEVLLLSPGGVREALFADEYYSVLWGKRRGFARVAIRAQRAIYPVFTENIREGIRVVQYGKHWFRWIYEITRLPFAIFYGYFPVKLRTYIGDPIYPQEGETEEQLADRTKVAIEAMIARYQWRPSNIIIAMLQRIPCFDAWVCQRNERNYAARQVKVD